MYFEGQYVVWDVWKSGVALSEFVDSCPLTFGFLMKNGFCKAPPETNAANFKLHYPPFQGYPATLMESTLTMVSDTCVQSHPDARTINELNLKEKTFNAVLRNAFCNQANINPQR